MNEWESKAKEVYQDSVKFLKEGMVGLEVMAGKTIEVSRLKLANQKSLYRLKTLFFELGQRVSEAINKSSADTIKITSDMVAYVKQIQQLQKTIESNVNHLKHVTIVGDKVKGKSKSAKVRRKKKSRNSI